MDLLTDPPREQWTYRPREEDGATVFDVYDNSGSDEPIYSGLLKEANALRLIESVKAGGYPDLSILADDQKGV